ncbi:hypothetical protein B566_EDAN017642, partial [Ephemera danica]
ILSKLCYCDCVTARIIVNSYSVSNNDAKIKLQIAMICFVLFVYITVVQGTSDLIYDDNYCYKAHLNHLSPNEFGFTRWLEDKIHVLENTPLFIPCCVNHFSSIEWIRTPHFR